MTRQISKNSIELIGNVESMNDFLLSTTCKLSNTQNFSTLLCSSEDLVNVVDQCYGSDSFKKFGPLVQLFFHPRFLARIMTSKFAPENIYRAPKGEAKVFQPPIIFQGQTRC